MAFHLAHPDRVRALMLFDTGPGFRNPEARRQWNERAEARARELETKGLAAVIHEEQSVASETQQAGELLAQREMTAQGQDLWQSCQTEVNGAPLWAMQKTGAGPLDPVWGYAMCNNVTQEIACPRKSGWDTRKPLPCRNPWGS